MFNEINVYQYDISLILQTRFWKYICVFQILSIHYLKGPFMYPFLCLLRYNKPNYFAKIFNPLIICLINSFHIFFNWKNILLIILAK